VVAAILRSNQDQSTTKTLGDILYVDRAKVRVPEEDWVQLVRAIAAGDQAALHALFATGC